MKHIALQIEQQKQYYRTSPLSKKPWNWKLCNYTEITLNFIKRHKHSATNLRKISREFWIFAKYSKIQEHCRWNKQEKTLFTCQTKEQNNAHFLKPIHCFIAIVCILILVPTCCAYVFSKLLSWNWKLKKHLFVILISCFWGWISLMSKYLLMTFVINYNQKNDSAIYKMFKLLYNFPRSFF